MNRAAPISRAFSTVVVACALLGYSAPVTAEGEESRLSVTTGYLAHRADIDDGPLGAHALILNAVLDDQGGKGRLEIDPNTARFDAFGDETGHTEIATRSINVTLTALDREDPAKKGRRLYEIKGEGLKGRVFLVRAREKSDSHRLLVAHKDGTVTSVFALQTGVERK